MSDDEKRASDDVELAKSQDDVEQAPLEPGAVPPPSIHFASRFDGLSGIIAPLITTLLAFLMGGLVVALTGKNPLKVYHAIFNGTGLNWFFHVGNYSARIPFSTQHMWFPWDTASVAAQNLQQTLLQTTPIILTGLAVAFAFRCGLFNIGGQGQYFAGTIFAVWLGSSFLNMSPWLHVPLVLVVGALAGAVWAGIAGILKATVGAHEVISTIMLNWTAIWVAEYLLGQGGPMQGSQPSIPISHDIAEGAKLPVIWGLKLLQGLSIGIFIAIAMLVVYWIIINRTTLGFEVRSVGFNPEAARYSGISVARSYFIAMAISGSFAGLAGALDITGWEYHLGQSDIPVNAIGFIGLAAALLGRNTALGVGMASLLFGALINGTSGRQLDPSIFRPDLAGNLTTIIQGLVILFVGLNLGGVWIWLKRRRRA
ncbi:MAG TPA: ABC transporter permease [Gaiellaceae bacterium]|jgi:simple sugar transport system permease protein|nr:ABC transporter permease [Gaiellaceae bacterium]